MSLWDKCIRQIKYVPYTFLFQNLYHVETNIVILITRTAVHMINPNQDGDKTGCSTMIPLQSLLF